jgi:hypothetical protein
MCEMPMLPQGCASLGYNFCNPNSLAVVCLIPAGGSLLQCIIAAPVRPVVDPLGGSPLGALAAAGNSQSNTAQLSVCVT